jgi:hypothetical protein
VMRRLWMGARRTEDARLTWPEHARAPAFSCRAPVRAFTTICICSTTLLLLHLSASNRACLCSLALAARSHEGIARQEQLVKHEVGVEWKEAQMCVPLCKTLAGSLLLCS